MFCVDTVAGFITEMPLFMDYVDVHINGTTNNFQDIPSYLARGCWKVIK